MSIKLCDRCATPATAWFEYRDQPGGRSVWAVVCDTCYHALDRQPPIKIQVILQGVGPQLVNQDPDRI